MKIVRPLAKKIGTFFNKLTAPVRKTKAWKWLRKHILRSPFRGYFVSSWQELKQVEWPSRSTSLKLTGIVVLFTLVFAAFTTIIDYGFEKLAKQIFLK